VLPGETGEAGVHLGRVLFRELSNGTNAEKFEIAEHSRADGDEVAELALRDHGSTPYHSLFIRYIMKEMYYNAAVGARDFHYVEWPGMSFRP
jgi:hypothetical protein